MDLNASGRNWDTLSNFKIRLKLSFLIRLTVRDGSGDPETSHSYAAIGLGCWGTSHDAPVLTLLSFYLTFPRFISSYTGKTRVIFPELTLFSSKRVIFINLWIVTISGGL